MAGKKITLDEAKKLIKNYRGDNSTGKLHSLTIDADHVRAILAQKDCKYLRFYIAKHHAEKSAVFDTSHTMVLMGADSSENAMTESGEIYDDVKICPPNCAGKNDF